MPTDPIGVELVNALGKASESLPAGSEPERLMHFTTLHDLDTINNAFGLEVSLDELDQMYYDIRREIVTSPIETDHRGKSPEHTVTAANFFFAYIITNEIETNNITMEQLQVLAQTSAQIANRNEALFIATHIYSLPEDAQARVDALVDHSSLIIERLPPDISKIPDTPDAYQSYMAEIHAQIQSLQIDLPIVEVLISAETVGRHIDARRDGAVYRNRVSPINAIATAIRYYKPEILEMPMPQLRELLILISKAAQAADKAILLGHLKYINDDCPIELFDQERLVPYEDLIVW